MSSLYLLLSFTFTAIIEEKQQHIKKIIQCLAWSEASKILIYVSYELENKETTVLLK